MNILQLLPSALAFFFILLQINSYKLTPTNPVPNISHSRVLDALRHRLFSWAYTHSYVSVGPGLEDIARNS
jgi:hypothetical protein